jgi:hypothetical protein
MSNNLPNLEDMLAAIDAEATKSQEAWSKVASLIHNAMKREAEALSSAKLALQDGAILRGELTATLNGIEERLRAAADAVPASIASA